MGPSALLYLHRNFFLDPLFVCVCCVTQYPTSEMAAGAPDMLWLFEVRQSLNRLYTDEGTSFTESSLFPLSSPQWGFPSGRRFRRVVLAGLLRGTGDELSPTNVCKVAVVASSGFFWARPLMWQWCTTWDGRRLEEAVSQSLFGLVVPVVIVYSHINLFWVKKDLTHVSVACANRGAEVYSAFVLCLHFNFLHWSFLRGFYSSLPCFLVPQGTALIKYMTQSQSYIERLWLLSMKIFISHEVSAGKFDRYICHRNSSASGSCCCCLPWLGSSACSSDLCTHIYCVGVFSILKWESNCSLTSGKELWEWGVILGRIYILGVFLGSTHSNAPLAIVL